MKRRTPSQLTYGQSALLARITLAWGNLDWLPLAGPDINTARSLLRRGLIELDRDGEDRFTGAPQWRARPAIEV